MPRMLVALSSICDRIPILTIQFVKGKDPLLGSAIASSLLINQTITQTQDLLFFHVLVTGNLPVSHQSVYPRKPMPWRWRVQFTRLASRLSPKLKSNWTIAGSMWLLVSFSQVSSGYSVAVVLHLHPMPWRWRVQFTPLALARVFFPSPWCGKRKADFAGEIYPTTQEKGE